jgi:hypothetical protein
MLLFHIVFAVLSLCSLFTEKRKLVAGSVLATVFSGAILSMQSGSSLLTTCKNLGVYSLTLLFVYLVKYHLPNIVRKLNSNSF